MPTIAKCQSKLTEMENDTTVKMLHLTSWMSSPKAFNEQLQAFCKWMGRSFLSVQRENLPTAKIAGQYRSRGKQLHCAVIHVLL